MSQENSPEHLDGAFDKLKTSLPMEEKEAIEAFIKFMNTFVLQLSKDPKNFIDLYNKILAYLIVNAPEQEKITAEAIPGNTVAGANNIVQFSRATPANNIVHGRKKLTSTTLKETHLE